MIFAANNCAREVDQMLARQRSKELAKKQRKGSPPASVVKKASSPKPVDRLPTEFTGEAQAKQAEREEVQTKQAERENVKVKEAEHASKIEEKTEAKDDFVEKPTERPLMRPSMPGRWIVLVWNTQFSFKPFLISFQHPHLAYLPWVKPIPYALIVWKAPVLCFLQLRWPRTLVL